MRLLSHRVWPLPLLVLPFLVVPAAPPPAQAAPRVLLAEPVTWVPSEGAIDPQSLALADADADGDLDVYVASSSSSDVHVVLNRLDETGVAPFTLHPGGPYELDAEDAVAPCTGARDLVVRDLTGDGRPDVLVACHDVGTGYRSVRTLLGQPGGALGDPFPTVVGMTPYVRGGMVLGTTLDHGSADAPAGSSLGLRMIYRGHVGDPSLAFLCTLTSQGDGTFARTATPDCVHGAYLPEPVDIVLLPREGHTDPESDWSFPDHLAPTVFVRDGSGATRGVVALGNYSEAPGPDDPGGRQRTGWSLPASGYWSESPFGAGSTPFTASTGDFDGDGDPEVAVGNRGTDLAGALVAVHDVEETSVVTSDVVVVPTAPALADSEVADLDGDGLDDLLLTAVDPTLPPGSSFAGRLVVHPGSASTFLDDPEYFQLPGAPSGQEVRDVVAGDLDGDERPDVLVANPGLNSFSFFRNLTAGPVDPEPEPPRCAGRAPTLWGTPGADRLTGTPGDDVVAGLGGDDTITGLGGNDVICGGPGNDVLRGGVGADRLDGGTGADRLFGDGGADLLAGGDQPDRLSGGAGGDSVHGGRADDVLLGDAGDDRILGEAGDDVLKGGPDRDNCAGGGGRDSAASCERRSSVP